MSRISNFKTHASSPLYKNAYALILNTGVTQGLGAAFWIVAARLYESREVGHASTLISAMMLISALTQFNLMSVLIRFLPRAGSQTKGLILKSYLLAMVSALVVSSAVLGIARLVSDENPFTLSLWMSISFVVSTVVWSVFSLQDSALTGLRKSMWIPMENGIHGFVKVIALIALIPFLGASGMFASWNIPTLLALIPINWLIFRKLVPKHVEITKATEQPIERNKVMKFIAGDYLAGLFAQASTTFMPLLVNASLGSVATAHFYVAQMIGTALDRVSLSLSSSLTVEGASDEKRLAEYTRSVLKNGLVIATGLAVLVGIMAPWLLQVFGSEYADNATTLLRLLALAAIARVFSMVYGSVARLTHKTHQIAYITSTQAAILIGGSLLLMPHFGITGVGMAAVASQALIVSFVGPKLLKVTRAA